MSAGRRREARRVAALKRSGIQICDLDCGKCRRAVCTGARMIADEGCGETDELAASLQRGVSPMLTALNELRRNGLAVGGAAGGVCEVKEGDQIMERGTGRSTALILIALGKAVNGGGGEIEFVDHFKHTYRLAEHWAREIEISADKLGLRVKVRVCGDRVFVRSDYLSEK